MPLRVESINLEVPEAERKWSLVARVEPGGSVAFNNIKAEGGPLPGLERITGMVLLQAFCAEDDTYSYIVRVAENKSGTISDNWDLMFNPPTPTIEIRIESGETQAFRGTVVQAIEDFDPESVFDKGMLRFTHEPITQSSPSLN